MAINHYWSICTAYSVLQRNKMVKRRDAPVLICDRTYFWQQTIWTILIIKVTVSQSDWHKVAQLTADQLIADHVIGDRKCIEKRKHSWSTISSEHQADRRSVNRKSNLIWLAMEKPDLNAQQTTDCWRDDSSEEVTKFQIKCTKLCSDVTFPLYNV